MNQTTIFDMMYPRYKITKPIRLIELNNLEIIVHKDGKIETCFHNNIRKNGRIMNTKGRILKAGIDKDGYYRITLSNNGKRKSYYVHRLVARAYLKDYDENLQVNHKNGIKTDNRIENLEIMTPLEHNRKHFEKLPKTKICIECGKEFEPPIKHRSRNVLCSKECWIKHQKKVSPFQNIPIASYKDGKKVKEYKSVKEASEDVNGLSTNIVKCLKGKTKSAYGYQWTYIEESR